MLSGLFTVLFGLGYFWDIHVLWYFIVMQVPSASGGFWGTGWPSFPAGCGRRNHWPHPLCLARVW